MKTVRHKKTIQFCDLRRQYISCRKEIDAAVSRVLSSGWYILGKEVENFEKEFASYCGSSSGIGVASGTEALQIALMACGVGKGDEVITVANAGVPMIVSITSTGATPVFVDIDPESYTMDVEKLKRWITKRTKVILPVHLYGQCADMDPILDTAKKYGLKVVEDACQAHGAVYKGKMAGSMGDVGCFSFYPTKNLGCYGDGGMIITDNKAFAGKIRMLRDYGQKNRYHHGIRGLNSRLDELQAAVLRVKLKHLKKWNDERMKLSGMYRRLIGNECVRLPVGMHYGEHVYHLYVILCVARDRLREYIRRRGIQTQIHYPVPVYKQPAYREFNRGSCLVTDRYSKEALSLPLYPGMPEDHLFYIAETINDFRA